MAWQWATLLCCTAVQSRLPSAALQLLNDLVQLLFYYTEHSIDGLMSDHAGGTAAHMQVDDPLHPTLNGYPPAEVSPQRPALCTAGWDSCDRLLYVQEAIEAAVEILGPDVPQGLWVALLAAQAEQPVKLQGLPLLACWLTSPSQASARTGAAAAGAAPASSARAQQQLKGQAAPALGRQQGREACSESRDSGSSPRSPAMVPANGDKQSPDGSPGASSDKCARGSPSWNDSGKSSTAMPGQDFSLDRHAEQAFQLQEAAMRAGYAAAALPLWEQFLWRFFSFQVRASLYFPLCMRHAYPLHCCGG